MKQHIKAILKDFYRGKPESTSVHCQLVGHCAPEIPASHVDIVLKEFASGEYTLEALDAAADKVLSYKPEVKKKDRYQITEES